jgi:hypothetical protein
LPRVVERRLGDRYDFLVEGRCARLHHFDSDSTV